MARFCQYCGSKVEPNERFCSLCGHEISKSEVREKKEPIELEERDKTIEDLKNRIRYLEQQVSSSKNTELVKLKQELNELKKRQEKPVFTQENQVRPPTRRSSSSGCGWCCCCIFIIFIIAIIFIVL